MTPHQERICQAVNMLAGCVITKEVADALIYAMTTPPDVAIDLDQFEVEQHGEYTFRAERFADVVDELHPLHEAQWQETEGYRAGIAMNPDYERIKDIERSGGLLQLTIRRDGDLVGHIRLYVSRSTHTQRLVAQEDTLYVAKDHRHGMLGLALARYGERQLRRIGVTEVRQDTKATNRADAILRRLKYEPVSTRWVKVLEEQA